jgi:2,4-dienoyl-CoA reductase (NADPH2)
VNRAEDPETLYDLATRGTKTVTLVEMIDKLGKDIGRTTRWGMLQDLTRSGVRTRTSARVLEITPNGLRIEADGITEEIQADTIVLAIGASRTTPWRRF